MPETETETETCSHCHQDVLFGALDDEDQCETCASSLCAKCNHIFLPDTLDAFHRCPHCSIECQECGSVVDSTDEFDRCPDCTIICNGCENAAEDLDSAGRCNDCHQECDDCHTTVDPENFPLDDYGHCGECARVCQNCGENIREYERDLLCESCASDADQNQTIHNYEYSPDPIFFPRPSKTQTFFGLEIEMECKEGMDVESFTEDILPEKAWYAKHDGSLKNGVEFVSHPGTIAYWQNIADWRWIQKATEEKGARAWETDSCGLHIHVSRQNISPLTLLKILQFFAKNKNYIRKISRRKPGALEHWSAIYTGEGECENKLPRKAKYSEGRKYEAVNLCHGNTIEFRIFRGTLNLESIKRNLLWVSLLLAFLQKASLRSLTPEAFHDFLKKEGVNFATKKQTEIVKDWSQSCV